MQPCIVSWDVFELWSHSMRLTHAPTCQHMCTPCIHMWTCTQFIYVHRLPTCSYRRTCIDICFMPPHTWIHRDTQVYTQPNVYHACAQECTHRAPGIWNHPSSHCTYRRTFVFPDHGVTVDCTADDTCRPVRQERTWCQEGMVLTTFGFTDLWKDYSDCPWGRVPTHFWVNKTKMGVVCTPFEKWQSFVAPKGHLCTTVTYLYSKCGL